MRTADSHSPFLIQSFAGVLVCQRDLSIQAYSKTLPELTGSGTKLQLGASLAEAFGRQFAHDARGWGQSLEVAGQEPTAFTYGIEENAFDISCQGGTDFFSFTFERSPGGRHFPAESITRRILQRARGQQTRQKTLDTAIRTVRMSLRADAVWLYEVGEHGGMSLKSQDGVPGARPRESTIDAALAGELTAGAGIVADYMDKGCELIFDKPETPNLIPKWLNRPSPALLTFLTGPETRSAHWYAIERSRGRLMVLLVDHGISGAADCARRQATKLAFEILLLLADAEHPDG